MSHPSSTSKITTPLALHEISLHHVSQLSSGKVVAAFAARKEQFQRIVDDITAEKPRSRPQHHLVVGQRGMGKTMLLARIAAELRLEPAHRERFVPLVFAEEQYAVDRLSKFWLNCLDSLADAREREGYTVSVDEIDDTVKRLTTRSVPGAKEDPTFAGEVYAAFAEAVAKTGQRPVLLVDNLQLVFERLESSQQHALRELLMRAGAPILVGASPSPPPQSQDYGAAFYEHFKVHYLRPLEEAEMRDLLLHLAEVTNRDDVRRRVLDHPARLKVLRLLTGGHPRTTLTLFLLYAEDFAASAFGDLEGLLDRVTPLYKARFEELTAQQQVIASAIATHWDPVTAPALAERTALPAGTISAQLDRLEKAGVVGRVELFGESRTGYQFAERFFNLWFLMRCAPRRRRRALEYLTRFLERYHEPDEGTSPAGNSEIVREEEGCFLGRGDSYGEGSESRNLLSDLPDSPLPDFPDTIRLREALLRASEQNWGLAREALSAAIELRRDGFCSSTTGEWLRASAVLVHLNYGGDLLSFLEGHGDTVARLRPWVEAVRAIEIGDKRALQNIAPEIRGSAEVFYEGIERHLSKLPEKTRRRPQPKPKKTRSRRK